MSPVDTCWIGSQCSAPMSDAGVPYSGARDLRGALRPQDSAVIVVS